ncbi:MFS transporter [Candidatus Bathyarchaeota archaeon]|nr:MFS transporter [Candidatus Bathyarchaeota archaeon]MBS7613958.1 MFS transporter [Candidatus Bathyarchaeota archaeon]MBS7618468.1 MFS transporter [Candidatus Bathyarchaeota archaeon]
MTVEERGREAKASKRILAIVTLSHAMQHLFVGLSILFPIMIAELNLSYSSFGLIIGISSFIGGILQIVFSMSSRAVARHILLAIGDFLIFIGGALTSLANGFIDFLLARSIFSIGVAPQHPMGAAILSDKYDEKTLGRAIGFFFGLAYIGNIVGPVAATLLSVYMGWRGAFLVFSLPPIIIGFLLLFCLRGRRPKHISSVKSSIKSDTMSLLSEKSIILILIALAINSGGTDLTIMTTYIPIFLANGIGADTYERGIIYTIGLLGGVIGPVMLGKYSAKIGYLKGAIISTSVSAILTYLLIIYTTPNLAIAIHIFCLFFMSFSIATLTQSYLLSTTEGYAKDLAVGVYFTTNFIFVSIWSSIMGFLLDYFTSFTPVLAVMGTLGLASSGILIASRRFGLKQ